MAIQRYTVIVKNQQVKQTQIVVPASIAAKAPVATVLSTGADKDGVRWHLLDQGGVQMLVKDTEIHV